MRLIKRVQDIDDARATLEANINNFLRSKGWIYTCSTPGSYWLWQRTHEGKIIMVDTTHAIAIQRALEAGL